MKKLLFLLLVVVSTKSFSQTFWEPRSTSFANSRGMNDLSIADANNVWIKAYDAVTTTNAILEYAKSTDGGQTWTNGNIGIPTTSTICSFKAISGQICYVGANPAGLYKTIDGGTTWSNKTTGLFTDATSFFDFGAFFTSDIGVAVGDPAGGFMEIYRTTDGGTNWVRIPSSSFSLPIIAGEYAFTDSYKQLGNAVYFFTNKHRTYRSLDAGLTWTVLENPFVATSLDTTPGGTMCLKSETEGIYYSGRDSYAYWKTTDGGTTFTEMSVAGTLRDGDLSFVPGTEDTYMSIGDDVDVAGRGTSFSCDGGLNWENINLLGDAVNVNGGNSVGFFSPTVGFASGFTTSSTVGGIFKYVGPEMGTATSVCPSSLANNKFSTSLFTVSPNPTSDKLTLTGENINQVQITDLLGKVVLNNTYATLSNVELNIAEFNSGVYMVKVTNNEGKTSVVKVVKQ